MTKYSVPFRVEVLRGRDHFWIRRVGDKEWQEFSSYWWGKPLFGSLRIRAQKKFLLTVEELPTEKKRAFKVKAERE